MPLCAFPGLFNVALGVLTENLAFLPSFPSRCLRRLSAIQLCWHKHYFGLEKERCNYVGGGLQGWTPVTDGNAVTVWGGPGCPVRWPSCSSVPQPHGLPCQCVWDRLRRMDKRLGTKMSAQPWGDCTKPSATGAVLRRKTIWSCRGLWQGQGPTSSFLLVEHPITYVERPYCPTALMSYVLCSCEIASFLCPCCTYKPQAFIRNKGWHCKSFGVEDSSLACHPDHTLVLCCWLALRRRKKALN